ncbi:MAG TPA: glycosyltransferase family 4 protein [Gaiellaceae bacterium]|nr:glycosyltransferase family 4 protein [Gaiellaceae bacterium]
MNVCLVAKEYPPETAHGGIGTQTWNKAQALANLGHAVFVVSGIAGDVEGPVRRVGAGVVVDRIGVPGAHEPVQTPAGFDVGYSWAVRTHLRKLLREVELDVIDFPEYGGEGFAFQIDSTPWNRVPVVVQLHGPLAMFTERIGWPERDSAEFEVGDFLEGASIRRADRLMACSSNIADFTSARYAVPRESIDVVHCGVDAQAFTPPAAPRDDARPTVLFVGNLAVNKGLRTVVEAVARLRSSYPDIVLRVLGKGDDVDDVLSHARRAGAGDAVELVGFVEDRARLPEFYGGADVFCSPAQHEVGVANVYIEAMACACPVVAADTGGAPEAVVDGETGLLVPPGDAEATAAALDRILGNRALARTFGEAGRRRVDDYFSMDRYIERVSSSYELAIERVRTALGADVSVGL